MWKKIKDWFMDGYERVRARNSKGQYIKDDPKEGDCHYRPLTKL